MQTMITNTTYEDTVMLLKEKIEDIADSGCVFSIYTTEYDINGNVLHDVFDIIHEATQIGYDYVTTIVYPTEEIQRVSFSDNVKYVVWLCKCHSKMLFDKDAIREKHIWKDVEWGKREKNYNPKGKDPGNVWIPTIDDGKANITEHILMSDDAVIERLVNMSCCKSDYEIFGGDRKRVILDRKSVEQTISNEKLLCGKVYFKTAEKMDSILPHTVKLGVTSPPYWNLKDYFKAGQIGQESYEIYLARMHTVWNECYDRLTDDGSMWININTRVNKGKVVLIPRAIVESCKRIGFYYKGIVIWHKSSGIPTGDKNIVDRHEYVMIFSKNEDFQIDMNVAQSFCDYKNDAINGHAFWNINRKAGSVGKQYIHPAIYPNGLVERIVDLVTCKGDTVLDPFLGSGTSLIAAINRGRNFVGYEYNEGFQELMQSRFDKEIDNENSNYQFIYEGQ